MNRTKSSILSYWRAVELFSPQSVPRVNPEELVFRAEATSPLLWHNPKFLQKKTPPMTVRRYVVYCGILGLEKVRTVLEDKLGRDPEAYDERTDGETCLFAFSVTEDGRALLDSFVLSSCAWSTGRTLDPGPKSAQWLSGFEKDAYETALQWAQRFSLLQDDEIGQQLQAKGGNVGRVLEYADILQTTKQIAEDLGVADLCTKDGSVDFEIRIKANFVAYRNRLKVDDQDFLNSFYVRDLGKVSVEVDESHIGKALSDFLAGEKETSTINRIDVRASISTLFQQLSPTLFPHGRWPGNGHHPLAFSQQFAINSMVQQLMHDPGLFAVNGPPGTGKTTLLRDLIAAVVVERAERLAELIRPESAFVQETRWKVGTYTRVISAWKASLRGFGIVIASNNNGAVENVTLEIPGKGAVDPSWLETTDYFRDFADRLIDPPAWALMAARLGNKQNCNQFKSRFWFPDEQASEDYSDDSALAGFLNYLKQIETSAQPDEWQQAVNRFQQALADEQSLRQTYAGIYKTYRQYNQKSQEIPKLKQALADAQRNHRQDDAQYQCARAKEVECLARLGKAKDERLDHRRFRPGVLEIILTVGKAFREWRVKDLQLAEKVEAAEAQQKTANQTILRCQRASEISHAALQQEQVRLAREQQSLVGYQAALDQAREQLGTAFPEVEHWTNDVSRELSSPWATPEWNEARSRVFLEALQLHKAFIVANAKIIRMNLHGAMDILTGDAPHDLSESVAEDAWNTLFFVIPVISTTFASFSRLFAHLGQESIGWLLIDEAGQATPQSAAGAIWRAQRTVVVGDPLQLEPVVTIPLTAQEALRQHYQVAETWTPGRMSVQQLADRQNRFGTYLKGQDEPLWVGSPLRVHRRCDHPMFDISNRTAYDGLMVYGTADRSALELPASSWIDVVSDEAHDHWIPAEGKAIQQLLNQLLQLGVLPDDIFLISPFRSVVRHLSGIARQCEGVHAGTIHTMQGKESDVVILVLGGSPHRPGAKQWASSKPNLVNVAVSRAKRRLYIVANRQAWQRYPYFSTCAALLRTVVQQEVES